MATRSGLLPAIGDLVLIGPGCGAQFASLDKPFWFRVTACHDSAVTFDRCYITGWAIGGSGLPVTHCVITSGLEIKREAH